MLLLQDKFLKILSHSNWVIGIAVVTKAKEREKEKFRS